LQVFIVVVIVQIMVIFSIFIPCVFSLFLCTVSIFMLIAFGSDAWRESVEDNVSVIALLLLYAPVIGQHSQKKSHIINTFSSIQSLHHPNEANSGNWKWMQYVPLKCHKKPSNPHGTKMHKITITQTKQMLKITGSEGLYFSILNYRILLDSFQLSNTFLSC